MHLLHVVKEEASFHEAHYNLALIYLEEDNTEKARHHAQKAAGLKSEHEEYQKLLNQIE